MGQESKFVGFGSSTASGASSGTSSSATSTGGSMSLPTHRSPIDFNAAYTSATTITLSGGVPYVSSSTQILYVLVLNETEETYALYTNGINCLLTYSGSVITIYGVTDPFDTNDEYEVGIAAQDKSYNETLDADYTHVLNPEYAHYTDPEHIVDFSATGATTIRRVIPNSGFKNLSVHTKLATNNAGDTTTVTFWGTNNDDADDSADTDWVDISTSLFGAASVSATGVSGSQEGLYFYDTSKIAHKYMIKVVTTAAGVTNAGDIYIKKA